MKRPVLFICAWIACILGFVGVVVPVLPTTPLILLATFLFAKSSPRCYAWIRATKVYRAYVAPFKEQGGITFKKKLHILGVSYTVMGISAFLVQKPIMWGVLGTMALFLLWLMCRHIPTIGDVPAAGARVTPARAPEED